MTRSEAITLLDDGVPRNRLRAARVLQALAEPRDAAIIRDRLRTEGDAHVRHALSRILHQLDPGAAPLVVAFNDDGLNATPNDNDQLVEDIWAEAREEIAGTLLHEITPLVGFMGDQALREFENFGSSRTKRTLDRLVQLLDVISDLRRAASPAEPQEFDLTDLVVQVVEEEQFASDARVRPARDDPVVIPGAPSLIRLAVCNGLRNAIDAIDALPEGGNGEVVINWGVTDSSVWISILDNGVGLPEASNRAFEMGNTTKSKTKHFGFGLAIALQAVKSASGEISLTPRDVGGVAFLVTWPLSLEDS